MNLVGVEPASVQVAGECPADGPGVDCGAVAEQWPDAVVKGDLVLRVSGDLTPSQEKAYEAASTGAG